MGAATTAIEPIDKSLFEFQSEAMSRLCTYGVHGVYLQSSWGPFAYSALSLIVGCSGIHSPYKYCQNQDTDTAKATQPDITISQEHGNTAFDPLFPIGAAVEPEPLVDTSFLGKYVRSVGAS